MASIKEFREFFLRSVQVNTGTKSDKELGYDTKYQVGNKTVFNRFLKKHYPSEDVFKKLFESLSFKLNVEDTAKETHQGLIKVSTQTEFDEEYDTDVNGFTLTPKTTQIRNLISGLLGNNEFSQQNYIADGDPITESLDSIDMALKGIVDNLSTITPQGLVAMWSGTVATIPTGWALCDGLNNTPNMKAKFVVGYSGVDDYDTIGNVGGDSSHTITTSELPSHSHGTRVTGSNGSTGINTLTLNVPTSLEMTYDAVDVIEETGNNQPINIRPSYFVIAYIIKL